MKTKTLSFALIVVAFCMTAGNLFAQSNLMLRVNVPFDFVADGKAFSAGNYEITQLQENILVLRNTAAHSSAIERTQADPTALAAQGTNTLVFHLTQGHYFLAQILTKDTNLTHKLGVSEREKELAKGKPASKPEIVSVLASTGNAGK